MPRISADYKPTEAEKRAWAKERAARIAIGVARAEAFSRATAGSIDGGEKPGCCAVYGHGKRGEK